MPHDKYFSETLLADEWRDLMGRLSLPGRDLLSGIVHGSVRELADDFYDHMLADGQASVFLSSQQVHERLHASLQKWLLDVLTSTGPQAIEGLIAAQRVIGDVHARLGIPVTLVARGARRLKLRLLERLGGDGPDGRDRQTAMLYVSQVLDLSMEAMTASYSRSHERSARSDEAYRLFSLMQNLGTERERQRASLLDWENGLVYQVATEGPLADVQDLSASTFGLWFTHKGQPSFGDTPEIQAISSLIDATDARLRDARAAGGQPVPRGPLLRAVRENVSQIKHVLGVLFEQMSELESGRDSLTQLMNRRFLPTVLRREVALAMRSRTSFALIMVDVDHFKSINDRHGHHAGDLALRAVAGVLLNGMRSSDYAFRYGGEEFLLVLVETSEEQAWQIAERLRQQVAAERIVLPGDVPLQVTISLGLAMHTDHPDYERTLSAADTALYAAKNLGRNRVERGGFAAGPAAGV